MGSPAETSGGSVEESVLVWNPRRLNAGAASTGKGVAGLKLGWLKEQLEAVRPTVVILFEVDGGREEVGLLRKWFRSVAGGYGLSVLAGEGAEGRGVSAPVGARSSIVNGSASGSVPGAGLSTVLRHSAWNVHAPVVHASSGSSQLTQGSSVEQPAEVVSSHIE